MLLDLGQTTSILAQDRSQLAVLQASATIAFGQEDHSTSPDLARLEVCFTAQPTMLPLARPGSVR